MKPGQLTTATSTPDEPITIERLARVATDWTARAGHVPDCLVCLEDVFYALCDQMPSTEIGVHSPLVGLNVYTVETMEEARQRARELTGQGHKVIVLTTREAEAEEISRSLGMTSDPLPGSEGTGQLPKAFPAFVALAVLLLSAPLSWAGGYGYYGSSYYYPSYSYYPSYGYPQSYGYQSYGYAPSYQYTYHNAGYSNGRYYPAGMYAWANGQWYLQGYGAFNGYDQAPSAVPAYTDSGWRSKILDVAKSRDEAAAYQTALKTLGVAPPPSPPPGGPPPGAYGMPAYASPNYGTFGVNGNTLYGYIAQSASTTANYGDNNPLILQQAVSRNLDTMGRMYGDSFTQTRQAATDDSEARTRNAELAIRMAAAIEFMRAAVPPASSTTTTKTTVQGVAPVPGVPLTTPAPGYGGDASQPPAPQQPVPQPQQAPTVDYQAVRTQACVACHGNKEPKAGFNVHQWPALEAKKRADIRKWLLTTKPDSACDGNNGKLSDEQRQAFFVP